MVIKRIYFDTSMAFSFERLTEIMRKSSMPIESLKAGEFVVFVNRKQTAFKLLATTNVMVYHNNKNRRFPITAITHFPEFFDGHTINITKAVERDIKQQTGWLT